MIEQVTSPVAQLFGVYGEHFTTLIVAGVLFFLLFIDFGVILKKFTSFSPLVAWILALGLCIIAAVSGVISTIVLFLIGIIGYVGAALLLIGLKVGSLIIELFIAQRIQSEKRTKEEIQKKSAEKMFKEVGKDLLKKLK